MSLPTDYLERTYAGVLGKMIGVFLGRPFEFWLHERIEAELGEIWYYLHEQFGVPLVVTDDDISGTFTFLRALPDYGNDPNLTAEQIGQTWLNYVVEGRTVLWWGGLGNSAEHTAYLRLKNGVPAPRSGSSELNGKILAEQIGAQIFIDGWAMVAPADPARAADLAGRAASVSHEGEAVYAAQLLAAMESQAYVEGDIDRLIDCGLTFIPRDSTIARLVSELREWRERTDDWRETRRYIGDNYGYDKYRGNCHVVPNHALIILGLLYGDDDFQRSLMVVNTSGWDTDCNSGNLGCLLGIKNGLAGIDQGPDWRGPVADRLLFSTADGGRSITDAATETIRVVNVGRALVGEAPLAPKDGARFHFSLPGSVQGWRVDEDALAGASLSLTNQERDGQEGDRVLALNYSHLAQGGVARAYVDTFIAPEDIDMPRYGLLASPTLYPGQVVTARLRASERNADPVQCSLFLGAYDGQDQVAVTMGPLTILQPGEDWAVEWRIPDQDGQPVARIGVEVRSHLPTDGTIELDTLTWGGTPELRLARPANGGTIWRRAWVSAVDHHGRNAVEPFRVMQDSGTGLLIHGTREWTDYKVGASVRPQLIRSAGVAARVQGLRRYYALVFTQDGRLKLVKALDGLHVLAEREWPWQPDVFCQMELDVQGHHIRARVDGEEVFAVEDTERPLTEGAIALVVEEGRLDVNEVWVGPLGSN